MQATMRKIGALCQKDFIDMFKNPSMLVCLIMPIGFAVLFRYMLSDVGVATVGEDPNAAGAAVGQILATFELSSSLCMAIGMVVSMAVVYGIAEEKEKHTLRTLMLANVSAGQIIVSRALISLVMMLIVAAACFLLLMFLRQLSCFLIWDWVFLGRCLLFCFRWCWGLLRAIR